MAPAKSTEQDLSLIDILWNQLLGAGTMKELRARATDPEFIARTTQLAPDDLKELRTRYAEYANTIRHTIKAQEISGMPVEITRARPVSTRHGETFYLTGTRLHDNSPFECFMPGTGATEKVPEGGSVYRFFNRTQLGDYPIRVVMVKKEHPTDSQKTVWDIEKYRENEQTSFIPF